MKLFDQIETDAQIEILDVGAAAIAEVPIYKSLMDKGLGKLNAFDGDKRQSEALSAAYGANARIFDHFLFDGSERNAYICYPESGMTSLFEPDPTALNFFTNFQNIGEVQRVETVQTSRLDDIEGLPNIDFVKMDIQGAELTVMQNGLSRLADCVAVQLEVSFIALYKNQPTFAEVDLWMRSQGFQPHTFINVKRWVIAPTIFNKSVKTPGNQLLEADIVYVRDPMRLDTLSDTQLIKMAMISHYSLRSLDLCIHLLRALSERGLAPDAMEELYRQNLGNFQ